MAPFLRSQTLALCAALSEFWNCTENWKLYVPVYPIVIVPLADETIPFWFVGVPIRIGLPLSTVVKV